MSHGPTMSQAVYDLGSQSFDPMWEEARADAWRTDTYVNFRDLCVFLNCVVACFFGKTCTVSVITVVLACDCDCVVSSRYTSAASYLSSMSSSSDAYIHTYMHAYIHTYIHTYLPFYIHTYLPTYIHTYIHTYLPFYLLDLSPSPLSFLPSLSPLKPLKLILGRS